MRHLGTLLLFALALLAPSMLRAEPCDEIDELTSRWGKVADYISAHQTEGKLDSAAMPAIAAEVKRLLPITRAFAKALAKEANQRKSLGEQLGPILDELTGLSGKGAWDEAAPVIERLIDVLDKITDACAAGAQ